VTPAARQLAKAEKDARAREKQVKRDARAATAPANKYGAKRTVVDGITFDSKHEARVWGQLGYAERCGLIRDLKRQVPVFLIGQHGPLLARNGRPMRLTFDFTYIDAETGHLIHADAKGKPTPDYEVRKAVVIAMGLHVLEL
jgi:hypothetical protein